MFAIRYRQPDAECTAGAWFAFGRHAPAVLLHHRFHQTKAQPGPRNILQTGNSDAIKTLEQFCLRLSWNAVTRVLHFDHDALIVTP